VKDGKIELEAPADWPEGTEVRIEPVDLTSRIKIPTREYFDWRTFDPAVHLKDGEPMVEEQATYGERLGESLPFEGQYVLIKGREIVGIFPTQDAALNEAVDRFGDYPAMVKRIVVLEPFVYLNSG
jgi:hypothetical protein